jgi:hypothetical protein
MSNIYQLAKYLNSVTHSTEQNHYWEANSHSGSQDIPREGSLPYSQQPTADPYKNGYYSTYVRIRKQSYQRLLLR